MKLIDFYVAHQRFFLKFDILWRLLFGGQKKGGRYVKKGENSLFHVKFKSLAQGICPFENLTFICIVKQKLNVACQVQCGFHVDIIIKHLFHVNFLQETLRLTESRSIQLVPRKSFHPRFFCVLSGHHGIGMLRRDCFWFRQVLTLYIFLRRRGEFCHPCHLYTY